MKKIIFYIMTLVVAATLLIVPAAATEGFSGEEIESVTVTEAVVGSETVFGNEEISEVIGVIEDSGSRAEAILSLAEKLGITVEEAENIIDTFISLGDEYLGENAAWDKFSAAVSEDMQFWAVIIVAAAAALSILGMLVMLAARVIPYTRSAKAYGKQTVEFNERIAEANSQTLGEMKELFAAAAKKAEAYRAVIEEKETVIENLSAQIVALKEANAKERRDMLMAEVYNLRMLKLVCDRTAMPLADKATIDLFYAKGIDAIKSDLSPEDVQRLEAVIATLDKVGVIGG